MTINSEGFGLKKTKKKKTKKVTRKTEEDLPKEEDPVEVIDSRSEHLNTLFPTLEGRMLVVKAGNDTNPVEDDQLKKMEDEINNLLEQFGVKCLVFVTNHLVDVSII